MVQPKVLLVMLEVELFLEIKVVQFLVVVRIILASLVLFMQSY